MIRDDPPGSEHRDAESLVTVTTDPGDGEAPVPTGDAGLGGHGLEGLRERTRLCGGTFWAGPCGAGFEVGARLPHATGPIAEPSSHSASAAHLARARRRVCRARVTAMATTVTGGTLVAGAVLAFMVYDAATCLQSSVTAMKVEIRRGGAQSSMVVTVH